VTSRGLKVLLITLGALVALVAAVGVAGYLWLRANRDRLVALGRGARTEGEAFGRGRTSSDCETESLARGDACEGLLCEAGAQIFLEACLRTAAEPPGYCDLVPSQHKIIESARFALSRCASAGRPGDKRCGRIVQAVQRHCHGN